MPQNWMTLISEYMGGFPRNYLSLDLETSGFPVHSPETLVLEAGYCLVSNGQDTRGSVFFDWSDPSASVDLIWLQDKIRYIGEKMREKGKNWSISYAGLQQEGFPPAAAMTQFAGLVDDCLQHGWPLVGHNIWHYDLAILKRHALELGIPLNITADQVIDLGMIELARQLQHLPTPGMHRSEWYTYLGRNKGKAKWALSPHCWETYGIMEKHALDEAEAHGAAYDAWTQHLLFEAMKELANVKIPAKRPTAIGRPRPRFPTAEGQ